jgi:hypothetical protein
MGFHQDRRDWAREEPLFGHLAARQARRNYNLKESLCCRFAAASATRNISLNYVLQTAGNPGAGSASICSALAGSKPSGIDGDFKPVHYPIVLRRP